MKNIQFISLIVLILIWIWSTHYVVSQIPEKVTAKMLAIEYDKVGWMENYVKINKITKEQVIAWLKQYEDQNGQIDANQAPQANNVQAPSNTWNKLSLEQAKKVTWDNVYILGNPDAEISFVEYSDLECPFCKKLHESGTIEQILKEFDGKVNFIFKQFPLGFHPQAQMEAEAALCVWDIAWSDKYYEFITNVFKNSKANWRSYDVSSIVDLAWKIWVDKTKLNACIKAWTNKDLAKTQTQEWANLFGITGTPWNVFVNNKTGEWDKLPGAYPFESFKAKISALMK